MFSRWDVAATRECRAARASLGDDVLAVVVAVQGVVAVVNARWATRPPLVSPSIPLPDPEAQLLLPSRPLTAQESSEEHLHASQALQKTGQQAQGVIQARTDRKRGSLFPAREPFQTRSRCR